MLCASVKNDQRLSSEYKGTSLVVQPAHGSFQSQPRDNVEYAFGLAGVAHGGSAVGPSWDKPSREYNCARGNNGTYLGLSQSINIHSAGETHGGGTVAALLTGPSSSTGDVDKTIRGGNMPAQAPNAGAGPSRGQKGKAPQAPIAKVSRPLLKLFGDARVVPANKEMLILPPIPREIFEELTTLFDDVDSHTGSTTEPETDEDEIERCKKVKRDMEG